MTNFLIGTILDVSPVMWLVVGAVYLIPILIIVGLVAFFAIKFVKKAKKKQQEEDTNNKDDNQNK